jgi:hypothetical protein
MGHKHTVIFSHVHWAGSKKNTGLPSGSLTATACRNVWKLLSDQERRAHALLLCGQSQRSDDGRWKHHYAVQVGAARHAVCNAFFVDLFQTSKNILTRSMAAGLSERGRPEYKAQSVQRWFQAMELLHEYQPDTVGAGRTCDAEPARRPLRTGVLIPYAHKKSVYEHYLEDMLADPGRRLSSEARDLHRDGTGFTARLSTFMEIWKRDFRHIKLRKHSRFAKCDDCVRLRELLRAPTPGDHRKRGRAPGRAKTAGPGQSAADEFRLHLSDMKAERLYYHEKRRAARDNPQDSLSIILDGADQGSYGQCSQPRDECIGAVF